MALTSSTVLKVKPGFKWETAHLEQPSHYIKPITEICKVSTLPRLHPGDCKHPRARGFPHPTDVHSMQDQNYLCWELKTVTKCRQLPAGSCLVPLLLGASIMLCINQKVTLDAAELTHCRSCVFHILPHLKEIVSQTHFFVTYSGNFDIRAQ